MRGDKREVAYKAGLSCLSKGTAHSTLWQRSDDADNDDDVCDEVEWMVAGVAGSEDATCGELIEELCGGKLFEGGVWFWGREVLRRSIDADLSSGHAPGTSYPVRIELGSFVRSRSQESISKM
jgi:hypothetical protein